MTACINSQALQAALSSGSAFKVIKQLPGFSGSTVELCYIPDIDEYFIRKTHNVSRNKQKLVQLQGLVYLPSVITVPDAAPDSLYMTYINGYSMAEYIPKYGTRDLEQYITQTMTQFAHEHTHGVQDWSSIFWRRLQDFAGDHDLPFDIEQLQQKLPARLPATLCHGDFTLENIIYSNGNFYMIDAVSGDYESYVFDLAKLRQDLDAGWFLRHTKNLLGVELNMLRNRLAAQFPEAFDPYLYILMLLRVYKYAVPGSLEHSLLLKEIHRLWK